jgi:hypothetical protein
MSKLHLRTVTACGKIIAAAKDRMPGDDADDPVAFLYEEDYEGTEVSSMDAGPYSRRLTWICEDCPATEVDRPGYSKTLFIFPETCAKVIR